MACIQARLFMQHHKTNGSVLRSSIAAEGTGKLSVRARAGRVKADVDFLTAAAITRDSGDESL